MLAEKVERSGLAKEAHIYVLVRFGKDMAVKHSGSPSKANENMHHRCLKLLAIMYLHNSKRITSEVKYVKYLLFFYFIPMKCGYSKSNMLKRKKLKGYWLIIN